MAGAETDAPPEGGWLQTLARRATMLAELGTAGYPPKTRRRLRNVNVGCYAVSVSSSFFALTFALEDADTFRSAVVINLMMAVTALAVPAMHRIHQFAGALFMGSLVMGGLFFIVGTTGREAGIQINFVAAGALAFAILELRHALLIAAIIAVALVLHVAAWLLFPQETVPAMRDAFIGQLYITTVVTITIIVAIVVYYAFYTAEQAEERNERLLNRVLPSAVVARLTTSPGEPISDSFEEAAVLFCDLAGFVPIARDLGAARTVAMLNALVRRFDRLAAEHDVEKIKTIGDAYMAAAIGPCSTAQNSTQLARMALRMQSAADATGGEFGVTLTLRVGIALGPAMAGIIGLQRFSYDLWGDAVNLAARLEASGEPGRIQVSTAFRETLGETFVFEPRGAIEVKGLGREETWFLVGEAAVAD